MEPTKKTGKKPYCLVTLRMCIRKIREQAATDTLEAETGPDPRVASVYYALARAGNEMADKFEKQAHLNQMRQKRKAVAA